MSSDRTDGAAESSGVEEPTPLGEPLSPAQEEWIQRLKDGVIDMSTSALLGGLEEESVALGWWRSHTAYLLKAGMEQIVWLNVHNEAQEPVHNMYVSGEAVRTAVREMGGLPDIILHTHLGADVDAVEPSKADVDNYPAWLVRVGVVYAPHRQEYSLYDHRGMYYRTMQGTTTPFERG